MWILFKKNETYAEVRKKQSFFSVDEEVFSIFRRYQNYKGGTVINYKLKKQEEKLQNMTFYEGQRLLLTDHMGNFLFSNQEMEEEKKAEIASWLKSHPKPEGIKMWDDYYLMNTAESAAGSFYVISLIPNKAVNQVFLSNMWSLILLVAATTIGSAYLAYDRAVRNYRQLYRIIDIFDRAEKNQELPKQGGQTFFHGVGNLSGN